MLGACSMSSIPQKNPKLALCFQVQCKGRSGFLGNVIQSPEMLSGDCSQLPEGVPGCPCLGFGGHLNHSWASTGWATQGGHPEMGQPQGTLLTTAGVLCPVLVSSGQERHGSSINLKRFILLDFHLLSRELGDLHLTFLSLFFFCFKE